ncbi:VPLPA-CTERM sorting domain-containing protein [Rhodovulum sp. DZ06]|uniref:VPLPA-CTERM sorting domain-containing protein n=1 Tax=Rhodovulum sp. DZ06 TaxID=3425126 RepID=UPI003D33A9DB
MTRIASFIAAAALAFGAASASAAPLTLSGMGMEKTWFDTEAAAAEMPDFVWGSADTAGADRIGMWVEFDDGTTGSLVISGVAPYWNTNGGTFPVVFEVATGLFSGYGGLHYLYNTAATTSFPQALAIAFNVNPTTPFGNNLELDYNNNSVNSQFRVSTAGWTSVEIATYSSTAEALSDVPLPAAAPLLALGLGGLVALRRRRG